MDVFHSILLGYLVVISGYLLKPPACVHVIYLEK